MSNFSFNGIRKNYCNYMDYDAGWGQTRELEINEVRGRPGGVLSNIKEEPREIEVSVLVDATYNTQTLYELADDFISWLTTDEPKELIFDREPDKVYYAILSSRIDTEEFVTFGKATVKFTCVDPYKYSVKTFENKAISDQVSIANTGNTDTPILVKARALQPSSYFMVTKNDEDYFMIGDDNVNKVYKDYSPSIYSSEITNMLGWNKQTSIDFTDNYTGGSVGGTFKQSDTKDSVLLDTESITGNGWHGALYKRSFTKSAQDFRTTVRFIIGHKNKGAVRASQYIYDTDNRVIASLGYVNPSPTQNIGRIIVTLFNQNGDQTKIYEYHNKPNTYTMNDFVIYIELIRVGNEFTIKTWKYTDQKQRIVFDNHKSTYTDKGNFYQRPVSAVSIYSAKYGNNKTFPLFIAGTFNHELLPKPVDANDLIIKQGDEVLIDMAGKSVLVNEELFLSEKTFGSDFFNIEKGVSELLIYPTGVFDTTVIWRDRFL
ncbi:distal tail protein Dit [Staphylococcus simulans]|uniref:distal tail protein Dit n=1 Tax=Staphylococcus simulans TaxID=1286 RepID=UPI000E6A03D0|nr:distal tail protein Dit [Staphylococcus simulans]RIN44319.1 phage tail protein [Staphylococcus simulans]RIN70954.1 phage tail protein [Staphylococcus simulans]